MPWKHFSVVTDGLRSSLGRCEPTPRPKFRDVWLEWDRLSNTSRSVMKRWRRDARHGHNVVRRSIMVCIVAQPPCVKWSAGLRRRQPTRRPIIFEEAINQLQTDDRRRCITSNERIFPSSSQRLFRWTNSAVIMPSPEMNVFSLSLSLSLSLCLTLRF